MMSDGPIIALEVAPCLDILVDPDAYVGRTVGLPPKRG